MHTEKCQRSTLRSLHIRFLSITVGTAALLMSEPIQAEAKQPQYNDTQEQINEEIYEGELQLLACLVYAEAGNQDMNGKKLVADVVLNRVDDPRFPGTITDVIYQPMQFSCVNDGGLDKAFFNVTDKCFTAVSEEVQNRANSEILYFTAGGYGKYGVPDFQYGDHWFCK